jgi:hypothetical protein
MGGGRNRTEDRLGEEDGNRIEGLEEEIEEQKSIVQDII